jgi:hypothetical protein
MIDFFSDPADLLEKAEYEYSLIIKSNSEKEICYSIHNAITSINHIFDWILSNDAISYEYKKLCFIEFNTYKEDEKKGKDYKIYFQADLFPERNDNQFIIRELCNNYKHYKVKKIEMTNKKANSAQLGTTCLGGSNAYTGYYENYKYVVDFEGKEIIIPDIIKNGIDEWKLFLSDNTNLITGDI